MSLLFCPKCGAEYRQGYTSCADCQVSLVASRTADTGSPEPVAEPPAEPGHPTRDPFCSFWKGQSARVCTELCAVLDEAGIPHRTVHREDHLFNIASQAPYEVGVPASLYEKAELAIRDAFGAEEETDQDSIPLLPPPSETTLAERAEANEWLGARYPEDATVEVWSGGDVERKEMIEMSLRENDLMTRSEEHQGLTKILVLPEDQARAARIVAEIENGAPLEG
jgi:hypothetical protein